MTTQPTTVPVSDRDKCECLAPAAYVVLHDCGDKAAFECTGMFATCVDCLADVLDRQIIHAANSIVRVRRAV